MSTDHEPAEIDERTGLEVIDRAGCVKLLEATPLGRIGFLSDGEQVILPVNYLWFEDSVVIRTLEGQKLDAAIFAQKVAFQIDGWEGHDRSGWSVLVKGTAHKVDEWAEIEILEREGLVPWAKSQWRPNWVRIDPVEITGRRLS